VNLFVLAALGNDLNVADDVLVELVQLVYPARFVFRKTNALIRALTRILERQKMLQTGQVLLRRLSVDCALVLPFKDSQGGTSTLERSDFKKNSLLRHAPVKKQPQYADRAKAFAPHQILGALVQFRVNVCFYRRRAIRPSSTKLLVGCLQLQNQTRHSYMIAETKLL
jgi:hypothetical protein